MTELILKMSISIDGFVSEAEGRNSWMFGNDEEAKSWSVEMLSTAGLHVVGSRTFETMAAHFPAATDAFAAPMNQIPKAVFTKQGSSILRHVPSAGAESWSQTYVAGGPLAEEIGQMKAQAGKPIIAHGGASFARSLIAQDLVDQYVLLVHPVALGAGLPLFSDLSEPAYLRLESSRAFPGGAVAQVYRRA